MKRRTFIKSIAITSAVTILTGIYSWQIEPFWLEFTKIKMPIKNLPKHLVGKTLMQISDMHVGNRFDRKYSIDSFKKAQKYKPDFVVYTGDFVSYENEEQFKQLAEVMRYAVLGKSGTLGVLGNHDYGKNWSKNDVADEICKILENEQIQMLRNEQTEIEGLNFIGIDDYWATNFKPELVMNKYKSSKANLVLCHNPDVLDLPIWNNYNDWVLCGHTHGGQCKAPFLPPPILPVKNKNYIAGIVNLEDGRTAYINRALGNLRQVRFNVRPEITIFTLS